LSILSLAINVISMSIMRHSSLIKFRASKEHRSVTKKHHKK
jgi:hypothetical protein